MCQQLTKIKIMKSVTENNSEATAKVKGLSHLCKLTKNENFDMIVGYGIAIGINILLDDIDKEIRESNDDTDKTIFLSGMKAYILDSIKNNEITKWANVMEYRDQENRFRYYNNK